MDVVCLICRYGSGISDLDVESLISDMDVISLISDMDIESLISDMDVASFISDMDVASLTSDMDLVSLTWKPYVWYGCCISAKQVVNRICRCQSPSSPLAWLTLLPFRSPRPSSSSPALSVSPALLPFSFPSIMITCQLDLSHFCDIQPSHERDELSAGVICMYVCARVHACTWVGGWVGGRVMGG